MKRYGLLILCLGIICAGCTENDYQQLAGYKRELEPIEEQLQELLDTYRGAALALGEGYGPRLPLEPARGRRMLEQARELAVDFEGIEIPPAAVEVAEIKREATSSVVDACELLDAFLYTWVGIVPPASGEPTVVSLDIELIGDFADQRLEVDEAFETARQKLEQGALSLARAILRSRGEDS